MMYRNHLLVFAGCLVLAACAGPGTGSNTDTTNNNASEQSVTTLEPPKPGPNAGAAEADAEAEEKAMERRIQSMAHYAAGKAAMERGQRAEAIKEFEQAALTDPTDEKVVLEVVQLFLVF